MTKAQFFNRLRKAVKDGKEFLDENCVTTFFINSIPFDTDTYVFNVEYNDGKEYLFIRHRVHRTDCSFCIPLLNIKEVVAI